MTALSKSSLWDSMQDYYNHMGPEAWTDEVVPSQITSNISLAKLYTQLIIAQINDFIIHNNNSLPSEPFCIVEIGAGHGKFSFYLLKALQKALAMYNYPANCLLYIMSDISEKNIESFANHPALQQFKQAGILDFACFNALTDDEIKLSNRKIKLGQLKTPLFVICNYLIDTLPHDAFQVQDGKLYETEIVIKQEKNNQQLAVKDYFANITYDFNHNAIGADYYANDKLNQVLAYYQQHFTDASFVIPIGGIEFLDRIRQFTNSHMVLLLADSAVADQAMFAGLTNPEIALHGSVSMTVNFDAIARYVEAHHGASLLMPNKTADFQVACFILNQAFPIANTTFTFNSSLSAFSVFDLFHLCYKDDEPNKAFADLDDLLALLNLADWDPTIFYDYHPTVLEFVEQYEITPAQRAALARGMAAVWDNFFKLEKAQDIPFAIGMIFYNIDEPKLALTYYELSIQHFGEQEETLFNIALAKEQLAEQTEAAIAEY